MVKMVDLVGLQVDLGGFAPNVCNVVTALSLETAFMPGGNPAVAATHLFIYSFEICKFHSFEMCIFTFCIQKKSCLVVVQLSWPKVPSRIKSSLGGWSIHPMQSVQECSFGDIEIWQTAKGVPLEVSGIERRTSSGR